MATIPKKHKVGEEIEWGDFDNPTKAKAVEVLNLPEAMTKEELDKWINVQHNNPESLLSRKRKKIEDQDTDLQTFSVDVEAAHIEVRAEDKEEAKEKANGIYYNKHGANLETHLLGEVHKE